MWSDVLCLLRGAMCRSWDKLGREHMLSEAWFLFRVLTAKWRKKWIAERAEEVVFFFLGSGYYMSEC